MSANFVGKASSQDLYLSFLESIPDKDLKAKHDIDKVNGNHEAVTGFIQEKLAAVLEKSNADLIERNNNLKKKFNKKEIVLDNRISELNSKMIILQRDNEANKTLIESLTKPDPTKTKMLNKLKKACISLLKRKLQDDPKKSVENIYETLQQHGQLISLDDLVEFMGDILELYEGILDSFEYIIENLQEKVSKGQNERELLRQNMIRLTEELQNKNKYIEKLNARNSYLIENKNKFFIETDEFDVLCTMINEARGDTLLKIKENIKDELSFLDTQSYEVTREVKTKLEDVIRNINPQSGELPTPYEIDTITEQLESTSIEEDDLETRFAVALNKTVTKAILPFKSIVNDVKYATDPEKLEETINGFMRLPITDIIPGIKEVLGFMVKDPSVYNVVFKQKMFSILNDLKKEDPQLRKDSPLYQNIKTSKYEYLKALDDLKEEYSDSDLTISSFEEILDEDYLVDDDTDDETTGDDTDDEGDMVVDQKYEGEGDNITIHQYLTDNPKIFIQNKDRECNGGFKKSFCEWTYNKEGEVEFFTNDHNQEILSRYDPNYWYIVLFNDKYDNFCFLTYDLSRENWIIVNLKKNPTIITKEYLKDNIDNNKYPIYSYDLNSKVGKIKIRDGDYDVSI